MVTQVEDFTDFTPPPAAELSRRLRGLRRWFDPRFYGLENVRPDAPSLFVGNHTIYGVIDSPLFYAGLYEKTGVYPRSLGDDYHFSVPGWGDMLRKYGSVPGSRENCAALMEAGQNVLVFPGGAREVAKRKGEENSLTWKNRTGFAAMAIRYQYPIQPFASLGPDDSLTILFDGDDFRESFIGRRLLRNEKVANFLRDGDIFMPVARGIGLTGIPRPERFYFKIGKPISTKEFAGKENNKSAQWELRERVADSIECMIGELKEIRAAEPLPLWRRLLAGRHKD